MLITELSIFMEDRKGRLAHALRVLAEAGINVEAFDIAHLPDGYGICRIIVGESEKAIEVLRANRMAAAEKPIVCVKMKHETGELSGLLELIAASDINIEYLYVGANNHLFFCFDLNDKAAKVLQDGGYELVGSFSL
jgi:hypothetical protein